MGQRQDEVKRSRAQTAVNKSKMYEKVGKDVWAKVIGKPVRCIGVDQAPCEGPSARCLSKWSMHSVPKGTLIDRAMDAIEQQNATVQGLVRSQIIFQDGSILRFQRSVPSMPSSLYCTGYFAAPTAISQKPSTKFIANALGHLNRGARKCSGSDNTAFNSLTTAIEDQIYIPASTGATSFAFTPVGYISHQVRANRVSKGVRPGLRDSSLSATQFRPRPSPAPVPRYNLI